MTAWVVDSLKRKHVFVLSSAAWTVLKTYAGWGSLEFPILILKNGASEVATFRLETVVGYGLGDPPNTSIY